MASAQKKENKKVTDKYLTPGSVAGLTTISAFIKNSNFKNKRDVERTLSTLDAYSLHKPARRKFPRAQILVLHAYHTLTLDLGVMSKFKFSNSHFSYFLVVVDVFSNMKWCRPVKKKDGPNVACALESILRNFQIGRVKYLWGDKGDN
jgi:hypothetical protein